METRSRNRHKNYQRRNLPAHVRKLIASALKEDMPFGDITTDAIGCEKVIGRARLVAKSDLVLSGADVFSACFKAINPKIKLKWNFEDGMRIKNRAVICQISGNLATVLKAERVALNFLGHLSGVATLTAQFVGSIKGTKTKITDTRKTTPGLRWLEKRAVIHGGGVNHRMNLSDQILIKENHIAVAGGIKKAVSNCSKSKKKIEVEVRNLQELDEALETRADRIMLDNMSTHAMKKAVKVVKGRVELEASGNMDLKRILKVAKTGVDFISVGKLTHSAPSADLSLLIEVDGK